MNAYPDTSFLCALYRKQGNTPQAIVFRRAMKEPLHATSLLEYEFLQSIRFQVWLHTQDPKKGYTKREGDAMQDYWDRHCAMGAVVRVPFDIVQVLRFGAFLSQGHTEARGHRTMDILHVATAVHLGAQEFLTFDANQRRLAKAAGLVVPL